MLPLKLNAQRHWSQISSEIVNLELSLIARSGNLWHLIWQVLSLSLLHLHMAGSDSQQKNAVASLCLLICKEVAAAAMR